MSNNSDVNYIMIARQLLQNGKSSEEIVDQLVSLGLEKYSAQNLVDEFIHPEEMKDSVEQWQTIIRIIAVILIAISILLYDKVAKLDPDSILVYLFSALGFVGVGVLVFSFLKR